MPVPAAPVAAVVIVVFGSRVHADGTPSGSLRRRCAGAARIGREHEERLRRVRYIVTGGRSSAAHPTEASVMALELRHAGIEASRITEEGESRSTHASISACVELVNDAQEIVVACSDRYHVPRLVLLFRLLGVRAVPGWIESGRRATGTGRWILCWLREVPALIWDLFVLGSGRRASKT